MEIMGFLLSYLGNSGRCHKSVRIIQEGFFSLRYSLEITIVIFLPEKYGCSIIFQANKLIFLGGKKTKGPKQIMQNRLRLSISDEDES